MIKSLFFLIWIFSLTSLSAQAQQAETVMEDNYWKAKLEGIQGSTTSGSIPFIKWAEDSLTVEKTYGINYVNIKGRFTEKVISANLNGRPLIVQEDGSFDILFGFPNDTKLFKLSVVSESQKNYSMQFKVSADDRDQEEDLGPPPRWRYSVGSGATILSYRQQRVTPFDETALTIKGSIAYKLVTNKVDLGLSAFYNAMVFSTKSPRNYKIQYLGVNAKAGYNLIGAPSNFRVNLNAGIYFNTSLTDSPIGFGNMIGPQLYPEFIYIFNNGHSLLLYGKFSPALSISGTLDFNDNREIAAGLHYSFPVSRTKRLSIGVDVSQLKISVAPNWGATNTYSLSAGLSF